MVRCLTGLKSAGFQSQLESIWHVSPNGWVVIQWNSLSVNGYIYIYIYIYIFYLLKVQTKKSFWTQEPSGRNVNIGQYVFNSNLKCWILQNVMLYFVCEIMLKLCVLNVKARLLYYKANLILSLSTCQRTRQNVFEYLLSNNLKIRKSISQY